MRVLYPLAFLAAASANCLITVTVLMALSDLAVAGDIDEIQRKDLALVQTQIEQIKVVVDRIDARQRTADPKTTRFFFDTPALLADLDAISSGIDDYLAPGRLQPRTPEPVDGDYLDDRGR